VKWTELYEERVQW